jgi:hypothetical protein
MRINTFRISALVGTAAAATLMSLAPVVNAATAVAAAAPPASMSVTAGGAGTNPLLPYGPNPQAPAESGYINDSHDEIDTSGGQIDLPF